MENPPSSQQGQQGDLFEPGYGYRVQLPVFDGPLDLLLHLIKKHRVDICDIPIALITEQYLLSIEQLQELDIDLAGEFLVMAAELMHIKSLMLLPKPEAAEEEGEDPRAELVRRLLEYQAIKEAAVGLAGLDIVDRDVFVHRPHPDDLPEPEEGGVREVDLVDFLKAFRRVLDRRPIERYEIEAEHLSVKECMMELAGKLQGQERIAFEELFDLGRAHGRAWLIVTFLAVLELVRIKMLRIVQTGHGGPIHILPQQALSPQAVEEADIDSFAPPPSEEGPDENKEVNDE